MFISPGWFQWRLMNARGSLNFLVSGFPDCLQPRQKSIEPALPLVVATIVPVTSSLRGFYGGDPTSLVVST
jgi:hypothetical protein